jgi:Ca2+-binding RTX toxin-like protein
MAFTTINGSATDPVVRFLGTNGPDQVAITSLPSDVPDTSATTFYSEGREGDDLWNIGVFAPNASIFGGQGNDVVTTNVAGLGIIGTNPLFLSGATIELNQGDDEFGNVQFAIDATISTLQGGQGNDTMWLGNLQSSYVNGNRGEDFIAMDDILSPSNTDRSSIFGGQGNDTFQIELGDSNSALTNSWVFGALGDDVMFIDVDTTAAGTIFDGGDGNDFLSATSTAVGTSQADLTMVGGTGNDSVTGGDGDDSIQGNDGDDFLVGGDGRDTVEGGNGADVVYGGRDDREGDSLSGGTGGNRFVSRDNDSATYTVDFTESTSRIIGGTTFRWGSGGVDVITDWTSASAGVNVIDTGLISNLDGSGTFQMSLDASTTDIDTRTNLALRGFFSADTQAFTVNEFGNDILITQTSSNPSGSWDNGDFNRDQSVILLNAGTSTLQSSQFVQEGSIV